MLDPKHFSPKFWENLKALKADGFRFPEDGELPPECQIEGGLSFLVNDKGDIKSVSQGSGSVLSWPDKAKPRRTP
jgi:hypothetical protein